MSPSERLQQVEELYHSAREREPDGRAAFLAEACPRKEVRRSRSAISPPHQRRPGTRTASLLH
jgi:hypothetical protein